MDNSNETIQKGMTIKLQDITYKDMKDYKKLLIDENLSMSEDMSNFIKSRIKK